MLSKGKSEVTKQIKHITNKDTHTNINNIENMGNKTENKRQKQRTNGEQAETYISLYIL